MQIYKIFYLLLKLKIMATSQKKTLSWWRKLLATGEFDNVSHKRFVSIIALIMLIGLSIMSAFGMSAETDYIYIYGILVGGESLLTTIDKTANAITKTKNAVKGDSSSTETTES
jgi:hypothetical protein